MMTRHSYLSSTQNEWMPQPCFALSKLERSTHVRNLGTAVDCVMALKQNFQNMCRAAYYHLHSISRIRRHTDVQSRKEVIHCFGDFSSRRMQQPPTWAAYIGPPQRLQLVRNACARIIMDLGKYEHITQYSGTYIGFPSRVTSASRPWCSLTNACTDLLLNTYLTYSQSTALPGHYGQQVECFLSSRRPRPK